MSGADRSSAFSVWLKFSGFAELGNVTSERD